MSAHTPEPWEVIDGREGADMETDTIGHFRVEAVKMCFSPLIARVGFDNLFSPEHGEETGFANACLIAAGPKLLAACKRAEFILTDPENDPPPAVKRVLDQLGMAINKAEGRDA